MQFIEITFFVGVFLFIWRVMIQPLLSLFINSIAEDLQSEEYFRPQDALVTVERRRSSDGVPLVGRRKGDKKNAV